MSTETHDSSQPLAPIEIAAKAVGSQVELARLIGVTPQALIKYKRRIPAERVLDIERASGVSRHVLRPDLYPESNAA